MTGRALLAAPHDADEGNALPRLGSQICLVRWQPRKDSSEIAN
ncbi:hypothetical protein QEU97_05050 [Trueperella pyogenes]